MPTATTQMVSQHNPYNDSYYYVQNASGSASQSTVPQGVPLNQPQTYSLTPHSEPYGQKS